MPPRQSKAIAPNTPKTPKKSSNPIKKNSTSTKRKREDSNTTVNAETSNSTKLTSRRSVDDKFLAAGDEDGAKSFIDEQEIEARVAAYLGYSDIADLRKFVLSHFFLHHFCRFAEKWSHKIRKHEAFEWIRDRFLRPGWPDFPLNEKKIGKYYQKSFTTEQGSKRSKYLAHILILMVYQAKEFSGEEKGVDDRSQDDYIEQLKSLRPFCQFPPNMKGRIIKFPRYETEHKESDLERYNRAWTLLKYFQFVTGCQNTWRTKFEHKDWEESKIVTRACIPSWMRDVSQLPTATENPELQRRKALPTMPVKLIWKREGGDAQERKALEEFIYENEDQLPFPDERTMCKSDPRVYDQEQFRDSIRRQYSLEKCKLQISTLRMIVPPRNPTHDSAVKRQFNLFTCDWNLMRESLDGSSQEADAGTKAVNIEVRLRLLDTANDEDLYESVEPPPQIDHLSQTVDDAVTAKTKETEEVRQTSMTASSERLGHGRRNQTLQINFSLIDGVLQVENFAAVAGIISTLDRTF